MRSDTPSRKRHPGQIARRPSTLRLFAVCPPGLEPWLADELRECGFGALREDIGGVGFQGPVRDLYAANLRLRLASRVLMRIGEFEAPDFHELEYRVASLPWDGLFRPGQPVRVDAACEESSALYHEGAVEERVLRILRDRCGIAPLPHRRDDEDAERSPRGQRVFVRIARNECTVSIDSTGELLHRRGYRRAVTRAPLRETLAAALLRYSGWDAASPLVDPFCGSGTIPIEAAMMARHIAPGRNRRFAFMEWPESDSDIWAALVAEADARVTDTCPPIRASDRDEGAIEIARSNAERAGVASNIDFSCRAVSAVELPDVPSTLVTNPPYNVRLEGGDLRNLYASLGRLIGEAPAPVRLTFLASDLVAAGHAGLRLEPGLPINNGGLRIRMVRSVSTPAPDDRRLWREAQARGLGPADRLFVVDVVRQEMRVVRDGTVESTHRISTARRGLCNRSGSNGTPWGWHEVSERIGEGLPVGAVLREREFTGRTIGPRSRPSSGDLIVSRIFWLSGLEEGVNRGADVDSHDRYIYIHGTNHEDLLGLPASAGCVRMDNMEIVQLFDRCRDGRVLVWIG